MERPVILAERFVKNAGWLEIGILEIYAFILTHIMLTSNNISKWRLRYWMLFSVIFFTQFILGLLVNDVFLMTGKLHLPVPAVIIAGPVYRGEGIVMLMLLVSTLLITGPAWCSHLCYIGAWDNFFARRKKNQKIPSRKTTMIIRYLMIVLVLLSAFLLNILGASPMLAFLLGLIFGIIGVLIMIFISGNLGYMVHCTTYCPVGGLVVLFSRLFPVKVKIKNNSCTMCNKCIRDCRFDALRNEDIKRGSAGWNCTLCGDCLNSCSSDLIRFSIFGSSQNFWRIYIAIVVGFHTVFIALARM